jgi:mono/diheme cytochrome c family protein
MKRLVVVLGLVACGKGDQAPPPAPADAAPMFGGPSAPPTPETEARQIWETGCVTCHGAAGRGDGSMAARLTPPPRDHSDPAWQDSVTDAQIADVIVRGGAALGMSASMPARTDLAGKPAVVDALVARIRSFRR